MTTHDQIAVPVIYLVIDSEPKRLRSIFLAFVILILKDPTDLHQGMVLEYTKKHAIGECAFNPRTQI